MESRLIRSVGITLDQISLEVGKPKVSNPSSRLEVFLDDAAGKKKKTDEEATVDCCADAQSNQTVIALKPRRVKFHVQLFTKCFYKQKRPVSDFLLGNVLTSNDAGAVVVDAKPSTHHSVVLFDCSAPTLSRNLCLIMTIGWVVRSFWVDPQSKKITATNCSYFHTIPSVDRQLYLTGNLQYCAFAIKASFVRSGMHMILHSHLNLANVFDAGRQKQDLLCVTFEHTSTDVSDDEHKYHKKLCNYKWTSYGDWCGKNQEGWNGSAGQVIGGRVAWSKSDKVRILTAKHFLTSATHKIAWFHQVMKCLYYMERKRKTKKFHGVAEDFINFIGGEINDAPDDDVEKELLTTYGAVMDARSYVSALG
jgi:hypothetical protein